MPGELDQPQGGHPEVEVDLPNPEVNQAEVPGGMNPRTDAHGQRSWIQKVLEQIVHSPLQWITPSEVVPVAVLAVERYLLEDEPRDMIPKPPLYCYDVTISDGVYREKCYLDPSLNYLVYKNILKVGIEMRIFRVSCRYNEKRLGQGILCIDYVHCGKTLDAISLEAPFRNSAHVEKPERPLRGGKSHYLALWNNEDPYGDIWLTDKQPEEHDFSNTNIISLYHLEQTWTDRRSFPALIVKVLYKSRLQYYGKPYKSVNEPYKTFLEVADSSAMVSVIMWNAMCPEWYKSLRVGLVLLLRGYSVKKNYSFRLKSFPVDPQIRPISSMEICLNLQDPPTNIIIIPESQVKPEWRLPKLSYRFTTRSELDDMPENETCDVVGIVVFVGRVQRSKKRGSYLDFWTHRWIHVADGTSEQPFIVELFSTSQPEVFENICPMMYFKCTQLKVVRNDNQVPKLLYLTTTNESHVFITGLEDQLYASDTKVNNINQWIKTNMDSEEMKNLVIGGYYPYPPVPETFPKYRSSLKAEMFFTPLSELGKEIEELHYREQKRITIQGIITAIKYIPHTTTGCTSLQGYNRHSAIKAAKNESKRQGPDGKQQQDDGPTGSQTTCSSLSPPKKKRIVQEKYTGLVSLPQPETSAERKENEPDMPAPKRASTIMRGRARKTLNHGWESPMWREKKHNLITHVNLSSVHPESIPRKFTLKHKNFLIQQFNAQPGKYIPPEEIPPKLTDFESARSLGHFQVTILGLNHEIAIDVAFLPMHGSEDMRTPYVDMLLSSMNYNCVYPQKVTEMVPGQRAIAGDIIKEVAELDRMHVVCILDICNLGDNMVEVYLHKIYSPKNIY